MTMPTAVLLAKGNMREWMRHERDVPVGMRPANIDTLWSDFHLALFAPPSLVHQAASASLLHLAPSPLSAVIEASPLARPPLNTAPVLLLLPGSERLSENARAGTHLTILRCRSSCVLRAPQTSLSWVSYCRTPCSSHHAHHAGCIVLPPSLSLSSFAPLFIQLGFRARTVYSGMVIGKSSKALDLTNVRSAGADEKLVLATPKIMTMEESIVYMADDEMAEITPKSVRLRKAELDMNKRMKAVKSKPKK
ncbi:hypothetical protein DFH08DRAFT_960189 [Mycena albidolilacea]|uniref:TypA/BipA C-terminal domain-containing protein n=1 Tax=Mycena albidolilacea TaxID=1033008 RepID=A0AAD7A1L2_9AGAR|nr:hypothetical protein DFH08DRAFT_960189 [Mycena albidolilacea]